MPMLVRIVAAILLAATLWDVVHEEHRPHIEPEPVRVVRYVQQLYMTKTEVPRLTQTTR